MVGDDRCCKLFVFRGDRRSACGDIRQSGQLAYLLSTHADRHVVDISFTVCLFVCFFVCPQDFGKGYLRPRSKGER